MNHMEGGPIENTVTERYNIIEIILNVALLSAGINILVTSSAPLRMALGASLIILTFIILLRTKILDIEEKINITSAILYDSSQNEVREIPEYRFSKMFKQDLEAAMSESEDIKSIWENKPISGYRMRNNTAETSAITLTEELYEYILLSILSTTTTDYFNRNTVDAVEYDRSEMPDILLDNRFIELFSKPMEERAAFQDKSLNEDSDNELPDHISEGDTVYAWSKDAKFEKFRLTLPKNCNVSRDELGRIVIKSDELTLRISSISEGLSTHIDYAVALLDNNVDIADASMIRLDASVDVSISYSGLFKNIHKEFKWVDKFIQKIENRLSVEKYQEDMNISQLKLSAKLTSEELKKE